MIYPESNNVFFVKEKDLQFEFDKENKKVVKMLIQEHGEIIEEAKRIE